jgi:hypothetical protein
MGDFMAAKSAALGALALACTVCVPAMAADLGAPSDGYRVQRVERWHAVREHHIIEVAIRPPLSHQYIINGYQFTAASPVCVGWAAGEHIRLVRGEWHGRCQTAVFYNVNRRQSCEMWCG